MLVESLKTIFKRDLLKVRLEIESYKNEKMIWHIEKGIANSAGNLCLHLVGNLNAYIGVGIGKTGYVRKRDLEFSSKDIPQTTLLKMVDDTLTMLDSSLDKLSDEQLHDIFPIKIWEHETEMGYTLIHLAAHLNYHLGQINYHRRLLDNELLPLL